MTVETENNIAIKVNHVSVIMRPHILFRKQMKKAHTALDDISFSVETGQVFGILGHNGAGKSTLLKILARIISPDTGSVFTYGIKPQLLTLNLGFEETLSGRDNAVMMAMYQGMTHHEALKTLDKIQEFSELGDWFDQPIATYSSGMKSRLGFATAIQTTSDLILLDEVLSVGDIHFKEKAAQEMQYLIQSNKTIVLVSNNPETIEKYAHHAMWLDHGKIKMSGTAKDVANAYSHHMLENKNTATGRHT